MKKRIRLWIGQSLPLSVLLSLLLSGLVVAHPHGQAQPTGRQGAQQRVPLRSTRPHRLAPDEQTEPLEKGTRPQIDLAQRVTLEVEVIDEATRRLLPHRVHVDDADGRYFPPDGHFDIEPPQGNSNNVSYEPDTINDGYDWAMCACQGTMGPP